MYKRQSLCCVAIFPMSACYRQSAQRGTLPKHLAVNVGTFFEFAKCLPGILLVMVYFPGPGQLAVLSFVFDEILDVFDRVSQKEPDLVRE